MPKCGEPAFAAQAETLLIDAAIAKDLLGAIANDLLAAGCTLRGDAAACDLVPR
jgi:glutamate-5-semialdehyde dehydrogenase